MSHRFFILVNLAAINPTVGSHQNSVALYMVDIEGALASLLFLLKMLDTSQTAAH